MAEKAYRYDFGYDANAAVQPKVKPQIQKQPEFKVIVNPLAGEIAREKAANAKAFKVATLLGALLVVMSLFCYSFVLMNDAQHNLTYMENQYLIHETKNQELKAELNALVAGVDIERYAVEKLGLVKVRSENEIYSRSNSENKVVFSAETE